MTENILDLIHDERSRKKFCSLLERDFDCKRAFGCSVACPLALAWLVTDLVENKNLSIGQAYRLSVRESISYEESVNIIREALEERELYPPKSPEQLKKDNADGGE